MRMGKFVARSVMVGGLMACLSLSTGVICCAKSSPSLLVSGKDIKSFDAGQTEIVLCVPYRKSKNAQVTKMKPLSPREVSHLKHRMIKHYAKLSELV